MMYLTYFSNVIKVMKSSSEAAEDENDVLNGDESESPASLQFASIEIANPVISLLNPSNSQPKKSILFFNCIDNIES